MPRQDLNLRPTDRKPKCLTVTPPRHLIRRRGSVKKTTAEQHCSRWRSQLHNRCSLKLGTHYPCPPAVHTGSMSVPSLRRKVAAAAAAVVDFVEHARRMWLILRQRCGRFDAVNRYRLSQETPADRRDCLRPSESVEDRVWPCGFSASICVVRLWSARAVN